MEPSLALSGDTLVIGAPAEDSNARGVNQDSMNDASTDSGAAYVLVRDAAGFWSQQAYLKASNADPARLVRSTQWRYPAT